MRSLTWLLLTTLVVVVKTVPQDVSHAPAKATSVPKIQLNDNHHPAGYRHHHVLDLFLSADTGLWYPAGENEPGIPIQAFRDGNGSLQIPGPFIRVPAGTEIRAAVRNAIRGASLTIHGLSAGPATEGKTEALTTRFGETSEVRFRLDVPALTTTGAQPRRVPSTNAIVRIRNSRVRLSSILPSACQTRTRRFLSSEFGRTFFAITTKTTPLSAPKWL